MKHEHEPGFIPRCFYAEIQRTMPIPSVEAAIVMEGGFLLLKRRNPPGKGEWWFPGGRIRIGESLTEALKREVKEETSLEIVKQKFVNVYSRVFPQRHDICIVFACWCKPGTIQLNEEHSHFTITDDYRRLHPYLKETIIDIVNCLALFQSQK